MKAILAVAVLLLLPTLSRADTSKASPPYLVSIRVAGTHFCGGAILSSEWILTAGHCAKPLLGKFDNVEIKGRSRDLGAQISLGGIEEPIVHPEYSILTIGGRSFTFHDLALIKLKKSIDFDKFAGVAAIDLPSPDDARLMDLAFVGLHEKEISTREDFIRYSETIRLEFDGWGSTLSSSEIKAQRLKPSQILKQISVRPLLQFVDPEMTPCPYDFYVDSRMFLQTCRVSKPIVGPCDSGGPLVMISAKNRETLIGVASYIEIDGDHSASNLNQYAQSEFQNVNFSRVDTELDWIFSTLKSRSIAVP